MLPVERTADSETHPWQHWSETPCAIWSGKLDKNGYGPHRRSFEVAHGPIPSGLTIDHLCRVKACQNPLHLQAVTRRENVRRQHMALRGGIRTGRGWPNADGSVA